MDRPSDSTGDILRVARRVGGREGTGRSREEGNPGFRHQPAGRSTEAALPIRHTVDKDQKGLKMYNSYVDSIGYLQSC